MADPSKPSPSIPLSSPEPPILEFHPDFNDETDDIILRSSNGVHYQVHSGTLRKASTVFSDMLAIPQPPSVLQQSHDPPIIPLEESSLDLERGLRLITTTPLIDTFSTLTAIENSAHFCDKYGIKGGLVLLHIIARAPLLPDAPLGLYRLASEFGWQDIVDQTAIHCLKDHPSRPNISTYFRGDHLIAHTHLVSLAYQRTTLFKQKLADPSTFFKFSGRDHKTTCRGCSADFGNKKWRAFRNRAIVAFSEHPGLTAFSDDPFDKWEETKELEPPEIYCAIHDSKDYTRLKDPMLLESIVANLPSTVT